MQQGSRILRPPGTGSGLEPPGRAPPRAGRADSSRPSSGPEATTPAVGRQVPLGLVVGHMSVKAQQEVVAQAERPEAVEVVGAGQSSRCR